MQSDDLVWDIIAHQHCSFKVKSDTQSFCRNKYNVTGLCNRMSCPLANSNYATVREVEGKAYLYMKVVERAHLPSKLWERVKLSSNTERAKEQIEQHLMYWPGFLLDKCKDRVDRIHEYLKRMEKLKKIDAPSLVPIKQKTERREATREQKALTAARLEKSLEKELIARLKSRAYGDAPLNINEDLWQAVLNREKEMESVPLESDVETEEEEIEDEDQERAFVSDMEESDDDDIEDGFGSSYDDEDDEDDDVSDDNDDIEEEPSDADDDGSQSDDSDASEHASKTQGPSQGRPKQFMGKQRHQTGLGRLIPGGADTKKRSGSDRKNKNKRAKGKPSLEIEYETEGPQFAR